jgi:hypothetical protein
MFGSHVKRLLLKVASSAVRRGAANVPCNLSDDGSAQGEIRPVSRSLAVVGPWSGLQFDRVAVSPPGACRLPPD